MAEQDIKQQNQKTQQKENPLDRAVSADLEKSKANQPQTESILKNQRLASNVQNSQQLAFNALFKTGTETQATTNKTNVTNAAGRQQQKEKRQTRQSPGSRAASNDTAAEIREQLSIRTATTQRNAAVGVSSRALNAASTGTVADLRQDPQQGTEEQGLQHSGMTDIEKNRPGSEPGAARSTDPLPSPEQAVKDIALNPSTETQKLLDLVGPEAVMTFREKLQQVWVTLDENATKNLDVIARMPATMTGMTAMELLMVESPQGIHFVAFLKNSNDFDILATFDRRALLPDSPSRQLIEAALMSYEQLDTVFKEGGQKLERSVRELASSRGTSDMVFQQLQRLMAQEKRRRRRFKGMIDYLVDKLDELDLEEDMADAPFTPKDMGKDLSGIGEGELEKGLVEEEDLLPGLKPEDNDFH